MQWKLMTFLLFILCVQSSAIAQPWIYYDILNPRNQFLLGSNPNKSAWMDSEGDAKFCGKNSEMHCFKVEAFQFAIPKKAIDVGAEWRNGDMSYKLVEKSHRSILGRNYLVYFIDTKFEKYQIRFMFSRESGLIAITTVDPTPGMFLVLDGACGFGATSSCRVSK